MTDPSLRKAGILAAVLVILSIAGWEIYLRSSGSAIAYDDGAELWSDKRAKVYMPSDQATVFIGSSRNKFDLDTRTWRDLTGEEPIQLAIEGTSPLPILDDLASDKNFKGKLVVDMTEGLLFSTALGALSEPRDNISHYKKRTPAQKASFVINHVLESKFVFLDKYGYSLNGMLDKAMIPNRPGVFTMPCLFPEDFGPVTFDRQDIMTKRFERDTFLQNQVKGIWNFYRSMNTDGPTTGKVLDSMLATIKTDIDKIRARGGKVIFVRTPSSGPMWQGEQHAFPRDQYWERTLVFTGCQGIHFSDYPATAHLQCPEFSHLKQSDAIVWTKTMIQAMQEKGWSFPHKPAQ